MYFTKDDIFTSPFIQECYRMIFVLIDRFLNFCDNNDLSVENLKTARIDMIFDYVEARFI